MGRVRRGWHRKLQIGRVEHDALTGLASEAPDVGILPYICTTSYQDTFCLDRISKFFGLSDRSGQMAFQPFGLSNTPFEPPHAYL